MRWDATTLRRGGSAPIGAYAAIGDGRTAALVAADGAIDWLCLPRFDSPPAFGALLDQRRGGRFALAPEVPYTTTRRYLEDTNVLETTFRTEAGVVRVRDALTLTARTSPWTELARVVEGVEGDVPMAWRADPRFGWAAAAPRWIRRGDVPVAVDDAGGVMVTVQAWGAGPVEVGRGGAGGRFRARPGHVAVLTAGAFRDEPLLLPRRDDVLARVDETVAYWREWIAPLRYDGDHAEAVRRSVLALGLCLHRDSGALVAAPTTSLPETVGGERNWDYRFCWLRDTSLALDAILKLGLRQLDHAVLTWVLRATSRTHPRLGPCYTLDAAPLTRVEDVDGVSGWRDSRPVRDGNAAGTQLQLGAWGDLLETIWCYVDAGNALDEATGRRVAELADHVLEIWRNPDAGIWEVGDDLRDYTRSKAGVWLTLDRAAALHRRGQLTAGDPGRWEAAREEVGAFIRERCWSPARGAYLRDGDGSGELDAATLLLGRMGVADPARLSATVDAIRDELGAGGPLLYRASAFRGREGAFVACSFWLVDALARCGRRDEAREAFAAMLEHRNDVGLLAEEIDPATGEQLGNTPQALSHLSLISAATVLDEAPGHGHDAAPPARAGAGSPRP
jgi:GH15 family glucan-1,4-alpha-glucosidase